MLNTLTYVLAAIACLTATRVPSLCVACSSQSPIPNTAYAVSVHIYLGCMQTCLATPAWSDGLVVQLHPSAAKSFGHRMAPTHMSIVADQPQGHSRHMSCTPGLPHAIRVSCASTTCRSWQRTAHASSCVIHKMMRHLMPAAPLPTTRRANHTMHVLQKACELSQPADVRRDHNVSLTH